MSEDKWTKAHTVHTCKETWVDKLAISWLLIFIGECLVLGVAILLELEGIVAVLRGLGFALGVSLTFWAFVHVFTREKVYRILGRGV